ncbi:MAG: methyltransferase domain-containing protein [Chloroflexi bacterium]|nr:methyltransferase domain-containing protein [Chloroflexota bacterium]
MASLERDLLTCCADLYGHPLTRWLLGDSMHPGGLALTSNLARLLALGPEDHVLDVGSGHGATPVHLAQTVGCRVTGVTLEPSGIMAARELARQHGVSGQTEFLQGDFREVSLREGSFDAVLAECVLSILADKQAALRRCRTLLRPGGRLGLTDVTVSGALPPELAGLSSLAGCVGGALELGQYRQMLEEAGFVVERCEESPNVASEFLKQVSGKLLIAAVAAGLGKIPLPLEALAEARRLVGVAQEAVEQGVLGYAVIVAHGEETPSAL